MHATCLVCTLKRSPEPSNSESLAEVVLAALPTWLGQPSSVAKRALERMDAFISETRNDGTPIGYTLPGQNWTYWNKGPGPGEEEWLTTQEREWSTNTGKTAAQNLLAVAKALQHAPVPAP
jgi:hypothetical protein